MGGAREAKRREISLCAGRRVHRSERARKSGPAPFGPVDPFGMPRPGRGKRQTQMTRGGSEKGAGQAPPLRQKKAVTTKVKTPTPNDGATREGQKPRGRPPAAP